MDLIEKRFELISWHFRDNKGVVRDNATNMIQLLFVQKLNLT